MLLLLLLLLLPAALGPMAAVATTADPSYVEWISSPADTRAVEPSGWQRERARLLRRVAELESQLERSRAACSPLRAGAEPCAVSASAGEPWLHAASIEAAEAARAPLDAGPQPRRRLRPGSQGFYVCCILAVSCVSMAALAAGLTMGLVSLDPMEMQMLQHADEKDVPGILEKRKLRQDKVAAEKVLPLISDHHKLLVTLLLMNSVANEALPLFLDKLVPSWAAVALSVSLVLMFGEILPSAIFTGSEQLQYASRFTGLVSCCQGMLLPIVWPIAKVLDRVLGEDHTPRYNFSQLRAMLGMHVKDAGHAEIVEFKGVEGQEFGIITSTNEHNFEGDSIVIYKGKGVPGILEDGQTCYVKPCCDIHGRNKNRTFELYSTEDRDKSKLLTFAKDSRLTEGHFEMKERDEHKIMRGITEITHMKVCEPARMKSLDKVSMLEVDECLDKEKLIQIDKEGHSRLPVYIKNKHNVRGFILVKNLIVYDPDDQLKVQNLLPLMKQPVVVKKDAKMLELLNEFQEHRTHFALVSDCPDKVRDAWKRNVDIPPDVHMAGIITLEDIIEQLLQEPIDDEADSPLKHSRSFWDNQDQTRKSLLGSNPNGLAGTGHAQHVSSPDLEQPLLEHDSLQKAAPLGQPDGDPSGCRVA